VRGAARPPRLQRLPQSSGVLDVILALIVYGTLLIGAVVLAWMYWDDVITGPKDGVG